MDKCCIVICVFGHVLFKTQCFLDTCVVSNTRYVLAVHPYKITVAVIVGSLLKMVSFASTLP
jgi:hypothetical protein